MLDSCYLSLLKNKTYRINIINTNFRGIQNNEKYQSIYKRKCKNNRK